MLIRNSRNTHYFSLKDILDASVDGKIIYVSLQYDINLNEKDLMNSYLASLNYHIPPVDPMNDFKSVLYLMTQLDYIISAGTAVLELAGYSNTPTFLLSNSSLQKYRFINEQYLWFDNINIVSKFSEKSKQQVILDTLNQINTKAHSSLPHI